MLTLAERRGHVLLSGKTGPTQRDRGYHGPSILLIENDTAVGTLLSEAVIKYSRMNT